MSAETRNVKTGVTIKEVNLPSKGPFQRGVPIRGFTVKAIIDQSSEYRSMGGSMVAMLVADGGRSWKDGQSALSGPRNIQPVTNESGEIVGEDITFHTMELRIDDKGEYQLRAKIEFVDGNESEVIATAKNVGRLVVN
jgi:hypothetical protein